MTIVKTFSVSKHIDRERLGDVVTEWLAGRAPKFRLKELRTLQSSDNEFHCLTIVVIGEEP